MKTHFTTFSLLITLLFSAPAMAVSQEDIDRLFAHPPTPGSTSMNNLLEAATTQAQQPNTLANLSPSAAPAPNSVGLTTTNPPPPTPVARTAANLENIFEVSYPDAENAISAALAERGIADKIGAMIDGRKNTAIFAYSQPIRVETRGLQIDKEHSRWSASIIFATLEGTVISAIPAAGHFNEVIEIPVLKRAMRNGETISESDVELRDFAANRTRTDTVADLSSLIGKTPTHSVSPFRPIRDTEIIAMPIIKRDAIVQISYNVPGMQITTSGQALSGGARGDVIDVRNTTSKKIIRAVIKNSNSVQVITPDIQTSQLTQ